MPIPKFYPNLTIPHGRLLLYAYELLGCDADPFVSFPAAGAAADDSEGVGLGRNPEYVDAGGVLGRLLALQRWDDARRRAPRPARARPAAEDGDQFLGRSRC